jgi:hypothetical protein
MKSRIYRDEDDALSIDSIDLALWGILGAVLVINVTTLLLLL